MFLGQERRGWCNRLIQQLMNGAGCGCRVEVQLIESAGVAIHARVGGDRSLPQEATEHEIFQYRRH